MSDDEKNKTEETQDEADQAPAAEEPSSAGPAVEEGTSSSPEAAGEEPSSTSPAADAESSDDAPADAPAAEEAEAEAPAAEAGEAPAEPDPEDELPWKERRRLQRSRQPHEARPQLSPEERAAQRAEDRRRRSEVRRGQRSKARQKRDGKGTGTGPAERLANAPKVRQGIVVSNKAEKSITVRIDIVRRHPTYEKVVRHSRTLHAHDERNEAGEGDVVRVVETRPLSKTKRWRLVEVVEKAR
jgi:small subunit ribosomal protein S17